MKESLSERYYNELPGKYAGYVGTTQRRELNVNQYLRAGMIVKILEVDTNGYFKGNFDYRANVETSTEDALTVKFSSGSSGNFYGKIRWNLKRNKERHPFQVADNRIYKGHVYLTTNLNLNENVFELDRIVHDIFEVTHYRELQLLKFSLLERKRKGAVDLPSDFSLNKSSGLYYEFYDSVQQIIFEKRKNLT